MAKKEKNDKSNKIRGRFKTFLYVFILVFSVTLLVLEGFIFYQRVYLSPFWVNGQSMYPYLNENAVDANGNKIGKTGSSALEGYVVEYGVMDKHKSAINKIKRFDIIVTKYTTSDSDLEKDKIKRVIGLPGETIKFTVTGVKHEHNGDLYVNGEYVAQPVDTSYIVEGDYSYYPQITLKEDEYFVLGDNRGNSSDSATHGPIKKAYITGKAVAIVGTATVYKKGKDYNVKDVKYHWPRYLK